MPIKGEIWYTAAVLDCEGFVGIRRDTLHNSYRALINVTQKDYEWLQKLQKMWHGHINEEPRARAEHARVWVWATYGEDLMHLLNTTKPYLKLKQAQAELCLRLQYRIDNRIGMPNGSMTKEERETRHLLYQQCKLLNRKGPRNDQLEFNLKTKSQLHLQLEGGSYVPN